MQTSTLELQGIDADNSSSSDIATILDRTSSRVRKTGVAGSTFNLLNTVVGGGVLSLPYAFAPFSPPPAPAQVINFLVNCGNQNLQYLLVPARLESAMAQLDTDRDGHIDAAEWEDAIEHALANKLADRAAKREMQAKAAAKEIEEFTGEFLSAARKCFTLIDKDGGGTLSKDEIVRAVKDEPEVIKFLKNCGEDNLQFLLQPARLKKALEILDGDDSGEIDVDEWELAINRGLAKRLEQLAVERERRERAAADADAEFSAEFLSAAREARSGVGPWNDSRSRGVAANAGTTAHAGTAASPR